MSIAYTYTVIAVDGPRKAMTVRYSSEGLQTVEAVVSMPSVGEALADVVAKSVPTYLWDEQARAVATVAAGTTGSGATTPTTLVVPGMSFKDFYGLFTNAEKNALIAATQTDVQAKRCYDELMMIGLVSVALPEVEMLLSQLVTLGALTGARKTAILAAMP